MSPRGSIALMKAAQAFAFYITAIMSFLMIFSIWRLYPCAQNDPAVRGEI
ncbi:hypothetical protein PO124_25900 [Bacillus licheniformis]|nr:hypothetical protein [Bacillus licheniformis]